MDFLTNNWEWILIGFMVLEKLVKLSPTKYDDILLDRSPTVSLQDAHAVLEIIETIYQQSGYDHSS